MRGNRLFFWESDCVAFCELLRRLLQTIASLSLTLQPLLFRVPCFFFVSDFPCFCGVFLLSFPGLHGFWKEKKKNLFFSGFRVPRPLYSRDPFYSDPTTPRIKRLGRTPQLSGFTGDFLVAVTDFAMNFSAKRDGFGDGFCGGFFVSCFPQEKSRILCDGFCDLLSLAKDAKGRK